MSEEMFYSNLDPTASTVSDLPDNMDDDAVLLKKTEIVDDLKRNPDDYNYTFVLHEKGKSEVWKSFKLVVYKGTRQPFARCDNCSCILAYTAKTGNASLNRHKCETIKSAGPSESVWSHQKPYTSNKLVDEKRKQLLNKKQLNFITKDLRPLSVTEGAGFLEFAQELINIGADYGKQNINDLLASRRTITGTVFPEIYNSIKAKVKIELSNNSTAFTTDLWTDEYSQRSFLTFTAHIINDNFELKKIVLGTRQFLNNQTPTNILSFCINILKDFVDFPEKKLAKSTIVTDNNANVVSAFRPYSRLSCACHNLNLAMQDVLENNEKLHELRTTLLCAKNLVRYFKQSGLNGELSKSLKEHVPTSWNSTFTMLEHFCECYNEIQATLIRSDEIKILGGLNYAICKSLVDFLKLFKDCSEDLSSDSKPTLNRYVLWEHTLQRHCSAGAEDSDIIRELKQQLLHVIKSRIVPDKLHYVAVFLDPNYKSLKFIPAHKREDVRSTVREMLQQIETDTNSNKTIDDDNDEIHSKRFKTGTSTSDSYFATFRDSSDDNTSHYDNVETELNYYTNLKCGNVDDILGFWKGSVNMPLLKKLAREILNIPASSPTNGRVFSSAGRILEERRTQLNAENVDYILFLNQNFDM